MNFVITYDVATTTREGERRLRRVARVCEGYGQRVQYSVFEVTCSRTDLARIIAKLEDEIEPSEDSLRIYPIYLEGFHNVLRFGIRRDLPHDQAWTI